MNGSISTFAIVLIAAAAVNAAPTNVTGTWRVTGPVIPDCTLAQSGTLLLGHCKGPVGDGEIEGVVDEATGNIQWDWKLPYNVLYFVGKLETQNRIKGTLQADKVGLIGSFIAERQ
jgi:hypothetical protein